MLLTRRSLSHGPGSIQRVQYHNTGGKACCNIDPFSLSYPAGFIILFFFFRNNELSLIQLMCHLVVKLIAISGRRVNQTAAPTVWGWSEIITAPF